MEEPSPNDKVQSARRLRWLCGEMIARLEETKNPNEFGDYGFAHAKEADALARSLGYSSGPITYSQIDYGTDNPQTCPLTHIRPGLDLKPA